MLPRFRNLLYTLCFFAFKLFLYTYDSGMFAETAAGRGLKVTELFTESLAWHGLRNVTVLQVELKKKEED